MKISRILGLGACSLWMALSSAQAMNPVTVNEVVKLHNAGLAEETIVAYVQSKNLNYELTADDTIALRQQGLSQAVLNAMLVSGGAAAVPAPAAQPVIPQPGMAPAVVTQPTVAVDDAYFRQELTPYGNWILAEDNQWYWQPTIVVSKRDWRPYWDQGHWVSTDYGWYWASDYPWGWAVFHYGRWQLHPHHGWIWAPDRTWGPAWVTWRSGGDYCGWAPLPPHANYDLVSGRFSYFGKVVDVNFDFGLDWNHFNFTYLREMGEQPRAHFRQPEEIRKVYSQTTIINNYTVIKNVNRTTINNTEVHAHVVNNGIDPARVAAVRGHAVDTIHIQDLRAPTATRAHEHLDVQTKTLEVYRPKLSDSPAHGQPARVVVPGNYNNNPGFGNSNNDNQRKQQR